MDPMDWLEQQIPGMEDSPLWTDYCIVVSVPNDFRPGLTNKVNVRRLRHVNYLDHTKRHAVMDQTTGLDMSTLPAAMEDALDEYCQEVWAALSPFV